MSQMKSWTHGEIEALQDGVGLQNDKGSYFFRSLKGSGWVGGHPNHMEPSGKRAYPIGKMRLLSRKEIIEGLVAVADITDTAAHIQVPQRTRREAEEIGKYLLSPRGAKALQARVKRMGSNQRVSTQMSLFPGNTRVIMTLGTKQAAARRIARRYLQSG